MGFFISPYQYLKSFVDILLMDSSVMIFIKTYSKNEIWTFSTTFEIMIPCGGTFVGKKRKKAWKVALLCLFWTLWWEKNRRALDNYESMDQAIKNSFLYLFWDWVQLYIEDGSLSLLDFLDWVDSR